MGWQFLADKARTGSRPWLTDMKRSLLIQGVAKLHLAFVATVHSQQPAGNSRVPEECVGTKFRVQQRHFFINQGKGDTLAQRAGKEEISNKRQPMISATLASWGHHAGKKVMCASKPHLKACRQGLLLLASPKFAKA
eukprot:1159348-Pelagomonas_calceolata.AAC.9